MGADRVYRVADLVADLAAGRATRRADDPAAMPAPAPPPGAASAPPPAAASTRRLRPRPPRRLGPRPPRRLGPRPPRRLRPHRLPLRCAADAAPNFVLQATRPSWAADPPTPPSGAPTTPSARRTASGAPLPPRPDARPRIVQDPVIIGLTRVSRSRLGSRLFTWFFVFVYLVIIIQLVWSILQG